MGNHQSWRGQISYGIFGSIQAVHVPRNRGSAGRKSDHRAIGSGSGVCNQIKSESTAHEKYGRKQSSSEITSAASHR